VPDRRAVEVEQDDAVVAHPHLVVVEAAVNRRRRGLGRLRRRPQVARLGRHVVDGLVEACGVQPRHRLRDRLHPRRALALAQRRPGRKRT
jgi:hypothetical protein